MNQNDDSTLSHNTRRLLDEATASLDDATVRQLRAARERALAAAARSAPETRRARRRGLWWPVGVAVSASVVAAVGAWLWLTGPAEMTRTLVAGIEDLELLAQNESPDFYADLEFYRWLDARRSAGS